MMKIKQLFKIGDQGALLYHRVMMVLMAGGVIVGILGGTQESRPYDERTYLIALSILALIMFLKFVDLGKRSKRCNKKSRKESTDK